MIDAEMFSQMEQKSTEEIEQAVNLLEVMKEAESMKFLTNYHEKYNVLVSILELKKASV